MVEGVVWTVIALLALASAGPLERYPREAEDYQNIDLSAYANFTANEVCFSDNEVFQKGDLMPNPGPCEECRCEPPSIVCQMVKCPVNNNGCRTIQQQNHCCPDYNCECDYNGQLYSDGERLDLPDQPCQVCYCKGGEVMCTSLTCYTRNDCEPQHVPGQCCPKYTNCPLRDMAVTNTDSKNVLAGSPNKVANSPKRQLQPWLLTNSAIQTSSAPVTKQPGDMATTDGLVVIVSDWLTERKTTPDDYTRMHAQHDIQSEAPNYLHTVQPAITRKSEVFTTKSIHESASSPLDEVIFTRIDLLNRKDKNVASSTQVVSNLLEESETTSVTTSKNNIDTKYDDKYSNSKGEKTTVTPVYSTSLTEVNVNEKVLNNDENITTVQSNNIRPEGKETTSARVDIKRLDILHVTDSSTNTELQNVKEKADDFTNSDLSETTQKPIKIVVEENVNSNQGENFSNDIKVNAGAKNKDGGTNDIYEKDLFGPNYVTGFSKVHVSETITPLYISEIQTQELEESAVKGSENDVITNKIFRNLIESTTGGIGLTTDSPALINEASTIAVKKEKLNLDNTVSNNQNGFMDYTTQTITTDVTDTTTPYFTEDHMVVFEVEPKRAKDNLREESVDQTTSLNKEYIAHGTGSAQILSKDETSSQIYKNDHPHDEFVNESIETEETTTDMSNNPEQFNDSIVVLSSEEAQFSIHEINPKDSLSDSSIVIVSDGKNVDNTTLEIDSTTLGFNNIDTNIDKLHGRIPESNKELETKELFKDNQSDDTSQETVNAPPILELNSHVPFLIIGGSESSESFEDESKVETTTDDAFGAKHKENDVYTETPETAEYVDSSTVSNSMEDRIADIILPKEKLSKNSSVVNNNEISMQLQDATTTEKDTITPPSTSPISLTPGDLKVLAEYLINEKIKPVETQQDSQYAPNQWLQGNLTSEENMSSIMAAANVNISVINQTSTKMEFNPKGIGSSKIDKQLLLKGNRVIDNVYKSVSKDKSINNKYNKNHLNNKLDGVPEKDLNDVSQTNMKPPTDSSEVNSFLLHEVTTPKYIHDELPSENVSTKNYNTEQSTVGIVELGNNNSNGSLMLPSENSTSSTSSLRSTDGVNESSIDHASKDINPVVNNIMMRNDSGNSKAFSRLDIKDSTDNTSKQSLPELPAPTLNSRNIQRFIPNEEVSHKIREMQ